MNKDLIMLIFYSLAFIWFLYCSTRFIITDAQDKKLRKQWGEILNKLEKTIEELEQKEKKKNE